MLNRSGESNSVDSDEAPDLIAPRLLPIEASLYHRFPMQLSEVPLYFSPSARSNFSTFHSSNISDLPAFRITK